MEFIAHGASVSCLALGQKSGRVMVTGGEDKKVNLWAIGKPNCIMVSSCCFGVMFLSRRSNYMRVCNFGPVLEDIQTTTTKLQIPNCRQKRAQK